MKKTFLLMSLVLASSYSQGEEREILNTPPSNATIASNLNSEAKEWLDGGRSGLRL